MGHEVTCSDVGCIGCEKDDVDYAARAAALEVKLRTCVGALREIVSWTDEPFAKNKAENALNAVEPI